MIDGCEPMKYFTKELYEQMQVRGSLVYHESIEELEQDKEWYVGEGRDYNEESLQRFEMISPFMMKYLPENLLKYVNDKSIMDCKFPEPVMREEITAWNTQWDLKWTCICEKYKQYYKSIYDRLTGDIRKLDNEIRIHDARIMDVTFKNNRIELVIKTAEDKDFNLIFSGVEIFEYKDSLINNVCLYMEIGLIDAEVFEIQILLDSSIDTKEIKIMASDLKVVELK